MNTPITRSSSSAKVLFALIIVGLIALLLLVDMRRRQAEQELRSVSVRLNQLTGGNGQENQEEAKRILAEVRKLYKLPTDVEPTVATIVKVEELRKLNPFYNKAKNGDHLIVTADRAILYDPVAKAIIDVVPVQIQQQADAQAGSSAAAGTSSRAAQQ